MVTLTGQDSRSPLPCADGDTFLREGPGGGRVRLAGRNVDTGWLLILLGLTGLKRHGAVVEDVHAQQQRHRRAVVGQRKPEKPVVLELRERQDNRIIWWASDVLAARCKQHQSNDSGVFHPRDYTIFPFAAPMNQTSSVLEGLN